MNFLFALIVFAVVVVTVIDGQSDEDAWRIYKKKFSKNYNIAADSGAQDKLHKQVFFLRNQKIKDNNNDPNSNYRRELTRFSDMLPEEFKQFCGAIPPSTQIQRANITDSQPRKLRQSTPSKFDYRYDSCMPEVKNQARCGSSWAFSAMTPMEFAFCKKNNGISVPLSEQQLLDCDTGDNGCNGGWPLKAWEYMVSNGVARGAQYPYKGIAGSCKYVDSMKAVGVKSYNHVEAESVVDMRYAVANFGPITAAIAVTDSLADYADGVYNDAECDGKPVNHAVVIVGWGSTNGVDYWIARNSWGPSWGLKGYFLIQRGVNKCKIESLPAFVLIE